MSVFFEYGTTTAYGNIAVPVPSTVRSAGVLTAVSQGVTGLAPNTLYHYRFVGNPTTSVQAALLGNDMTFTTGQGVLQNITLNTTIEGTACFDATQTITLAGTPNTFMVTPTGHVDLIAGVNILMLPGTMVQPGGYLHGRISTQYCNPTDDPVMAASASDDNMEIPEHCLFKVYPNPTTGEFTLAMMDAGPSLVEIFNLQGSAILKKHVDGNGKYELSLSGCPSGIYLIRVVTRTRTENSRIIRL